MHDRWKENLPGCDCCCKSSNDSDSKAPGSCPVCCGYSSQKLIMSIACQLCGGFIARFAALGKNLVCGEPFGGSGLGSGTGLQIGVRELLEVGADAGDVLWRRLSGLEYAGHGGCDAMTPGEPATCLAGGAPVERLVRRWCRSVTQASEQRSRRGRLEDCSWLQR